MRMIIEGRDYSVNGIGRLSLFDLLELKRQTGLSVEEFQSGLAAMDGATSAGVLSDEKSLVALGALVWLTRRKAGEVLTFEQACDFPLETLEIVAEPGDEVGDDAAPDPQ